MESVIINGVRYVPEPVRRAEFFVCFDGDGFNGGRPDFFVHKVKQNLEAMPEKQQVRVWCDDLGWHAEATR